MVAKRQNAELVSGDDTLLLVSLTDRTGAPWPVADLAGVDWQMARSVRATPDVVKTLATGIQLGPATIPSAGAPLTLAAHQIAVALVPADTATREGRYYHEMQITDAAGAVRTVLSGTLKFIPHLIR